MQNLHLKLTSKYPQYHNWHQTKHHNKIHWGAFIVFTLLVFGTILRWTPISFAADATAPTTPATLTAAVVSSSQINLSWTASTDDVAVTGYKIYRCAGSACAPTVQIATSAANSYSDTGLTASTAYTYAISAYDAVGNESGKSNSVQATTKQAGGTWQQTLEQNFDIADTFDNYDDWKGLAGRIGSECQTNPNDLPKYQNGTNGLWDMYCYANDSMPGDYGNWIANHGPIYQVGSKSLKLGTQGHNAAEIKTYIGDGDPSSGYSDIYVFYRLYLPKNTWPTYMVKSGNSGTWRVSQPVPPQETGIMGYKEGDPYLYLTAWKFFNFGTGFCNVEKWEDPTDGDNICGSGYYGDGPSVYGGAELWYNLLYNDPNPYTISASASRISAQPPYYFSSYTTYPAKPNYIPTNELVGIEIHYKLESNTSCTDAVDCDGQFESWVYDSNHPNGLKLQDNQKIKFRSPGYDASKINRLWINSNKHDMDAGGGGITGEYYCGEGMDCVMYMDDFIVDDMRVGPTYFSLLNDQPSPSDIQAPTTPINLTATPISSSQINLSWTASNDNTAVTGYKIYRCSGSGCTPTQLVNSQLANSLTYSDTGLTASTTYTYAVSAYDAAGNESGKSGSVSATTLSQFKPSDLNQDQKVDQQDFDILKQDWNRTDKPVSDINQDGVVDSRDLGIMMSEWTR